MIFLNKTTTYFIKLLGQKMSHRIRHFLRRSLRERMFDNSRSEMFEKLYDGSRRKVRHDPRKRLPNSLWHNLRRKMWYKVSLHKIEIWFHWLFVRMCRIPKISLKYLIISTNLQQVCTNTVSSIYLRLTDNPTSN